uniref:Ferritin n=1 Tax=Artemia urmiana TaxID=112782 RepID=B0LVG2_9CRUS|nr:artemin [Artemia urmiana]
MATEGARNIGQSAPEGKVQMDCPSRHNFDPECEKAFVEHIHLELASSYHAWSMWAFYARDCKAAVGMTRLCEWASHVSAQRARRMAAYVLTRGGHVDYKEIPAPKKQGWDNFEDAFSHCVANKKRILTSLQSLYQCCQSKDAHCSNFIQTDMMDEVIAWNKFLSDCLSNIHCIGSQGMGPWVFDRWLARIVMSKFKHPKIPSLSTSDLESNIPNELFDAEGDMVRAIKKL